MEEPATDNLLRALTQAQIDAFRRDGYVSIGKLLDDSLLGALQTEYDRIFAEARETQKLRNNRRRRGNATDHADVRAQPSLPPAAFR